MTGAERAVRALRAADRPKLVELWLASWREAMPSIDFEARRRWIEVFLADPSHTTLVAERGEPIGFASVAGSTLLQLAVAPAAKGDGTAGLLLRAAKARAPAGLDLAVNVANPRAVAFYTREGFVATGRSRNPASGLATILMRWTPPPADPRRVRDP